MASSIGNEMQKFADQNKDAIQKTVSSINSEAGKALEQGPIGSFPTPVSGISSLPNTLGLGDSTSSGDNSLVSDGSASSGPSTGSGAETGVANDIMCKGFQELFTKNQAKYNEFLFRSLEKYFNEGQTKLLLDKMLNRNMGEYIKSNQFSGIIKSEIQKSVGSVMQTSLKLELRNKKNYIGMCNEIGKFTRGGRRTRTRTRDPSKKRRTFKRRN